MCSTRRDLEWICLKLAGPNGRRAVIIACVKGGTAGGLFSVCDGPSPNKWVDLCVILICLIRETAPPSHI